MADERFCRFASKLVINGVTIVDGILSVSAIDIIVNRCLSENKLPLIMFKSLSNAEKGFHMHYDIALPEGFLAFEVEAISGPVVAPQPIAGPAA